MKDWRILLISLLFAILVWIIHVFSLEYSSYIQFKVVAKTNLTGYSPEAVADETLFLRGKADGFYIMAAKASDPTISLDIDEKYFTPVEGDDEAFSVSVQDIRERIVEAFGGDLSVDHINNERLTFRFVKQNYKKVPVSAVSDVILKKQYMQVGNIALNPDSVLVYGPEVETDRISEVNTKLIETFPLNKSTQGYIELEHINGIRFSEEKIHYSITVDRFVEQTRKFTIKVENVPYGKTIMLIPSEVNVTFRTPFGSKGKSDDAEKMSLTVDYKDFSTSINAKVIPTLNSNGLQVYSYTLSPAVVECVQIESR